MKKTATLFTSLLFVFLLQAQIFINTGNPNIDKYKNENPNATIWENGKEKPMTTSTPKEEPKKEIEVKKEEPVKKEAEVKVPVQTATTTTAENNSEGFPPNAEPGKCYARCLSPDEYEVVDEQVLVTPATVKVEKIPAKYITVYDTVIVTPASKKTISVPPVFETITEDVMVKPAEKKWVKGKGDANCLSQNPKDCEVWCLTEVPAQYKKVTRQTVKNPEMKKEVDVPAVTKVVPRKQLVEEAKENKTEIPAVYKMVKTKILKKKGGFQEWREVLCQQAITDTKIQQIQTALKAEGYDPGPIDNQMGSKTKEALQKFQVDKGLPVGNLNMETLNALGVK